MTNERIKSLQAENERLREALLEIYDQYVGSHIESDLGSAAVTMGEIARQALQQFAIVNSEQES